MVPIQGRRDERGEERGDPNIVALLSLKLLLLGFFILLNTLAQFQEDRIRRVLESVDEAFNGQVEARRSHAPHAAALGILDEAESLFSEVGRLFESRIPAVQVEPSPDGTRLRLELAQGALFAPSGVALQPGRGLLLNRFVAALLQGGRAGLEYELEILYGVARGDVGPMTASGARSLEVRRSGMLARDLVTRGLPADRLSVAVLPGHAGRLQLVVRLYQGQRPALDYRGLAE
jgi:hypothetical protein